MSHAMVRCRKPRLVAGGPSDRLSQPAALLKVVGNRGSGGLISQSPTVLGLSLAA